MAKTGRAGLSHEQKAQLWARWKAGDSVSDIARSLEVAGSRGVIRYGGSRHVCNVRSARSVGSSRATVAAAHTARVRPTP